MQGKCILNDDMADILDKVQEAEVLVGLNL